MQSPSGHQHRSITTLIPLPCISSRGYHISDPAILSIFFFFWHIKALHVTHHCLNYCSIRNCRINSISSIHRRDNLLAAMRQTIAKLASASAVQNGLRPKPMALLPPIPLYRRLLRAHRKYLPAEMRLLGDQYIKAEFRAHRNVDNPAHLVCFFL